MYIQSFDALVLHERTGDGHPLRWQPYDVPDAPEGGWWLTSSDDVPMLLTIDHLLIDPMTLQLGWSDGRDNPVVIYARPGEVLACPEPGFWDPVSRVIAYVGKPLVRVTWTQPGEAGLLALADVAEAIQKPKEPSIGVLSARLGLMLGYDEPQSITLGYPCFSFQSVAKLPNNRTAEPVWPAQSAQRAPDPAPVPAPALRDNEAALAVARAAQRDIDRVQDAALERARLARAAGRAERAA